MGRCSVSIRLGPTDVPFWRVDKPITGLVDLNIPSIQTVAAVDVRLTCVETYAATAQDGTILSGTTTHFRKHIALLTRPTIVDTHTSLPFSLQLPPVKVLPPYAPIRTGVEGKPDVGVRWIMEALATLAEGHQESSHTDVRIFPPPQSMPNLRRRRRVETKAIAKLSKRKRFAQLFQRSRPSGPLSESTPEVIVQVSYPRAGIPQMPLPAQIDVKLKLTLPQEPMSVNRVSLWLIENCEARIKDVTETYVKRHEIGVARMNENVDNELDLSPLIRNFKLPEPMPEFSTSNLKMWYELRAEVKVGPSNETESISSSSGGSSGGHSGSGRSSLGHNSRFQILVIEKAVPLLNASSCWVAGGTTGQFSGAGITCVDDVSPYVSSSSVSSSSLSLSDSDVSLPSSAESVVSSIDDVATDLLPVVDNDALGAFSTLPVTGSSFDDEW